MSDRGEEHDRAWNDYPDAIGRRFTDIVRDGAYHSLGDLACWCNPAFEVREHGEGGPPVIILTHNDPPHSFVSGDMKREAIQMNESAYEGYEEINIEELLLDGDAMICEVCGAIEGHPKSPPTCVGPAMISLQWIGDDGTDPETEE